MGCRRRIRKLALGSLIAMAIIASVSWGVAMKFLGAKPYPGPSSGDFVGRAAKPSPDPYQTDPSPATYEERKRDVLALCAERDDYWTGLAGLVLGAHGVSDASVQEAINSVRERKDCADFRAARLVRFLCGFGNHPLVPPSQRDAVAEALKGFKYWKDQGGECSMIMETENHQILFNSCEYLVGQTFPDDIFSNDGKTGRWHMEHAKGLILDWMKRRIHFGFCEWDSNVYLNETFPAVANLADFAQDEAISRQATMMLDLILFDIAVDLHKGTYGTSHGRTYAREVVSGRDDHLRGLVWLVFGLGDPGDVGGFASMCLATSQRYTPPMAIQLAGQLRPEEFWSQERHGIHLSDAPKYGYAYNDPKAIWFFWEMGAYTQPEIVSLSARLIEEWGFWDQPYFEDIPFLRGPMKGLNKVGLLKVLMRYPWIKSHMTLLGEVNKVTYRTPDAMLSTAQCYRPGGMGNQHHTWQATLDQDALVFVTHPGNMESKGMTPTYWGGQARFPKSAQQGPVHVSIYKIGKAAALGEPALYGFTHAYFPKWAFDEITESNAWVFGRKGDGYVALRCSRPIQWTTTGRDAGHEIVAEGREAIWICQVGRKAVDGTFQDFVNAISSAQLEFAGDQVQYAAPGVGSLKFSWTGPLTVDNMPVHTDDYPRFANPYCHAEFGTEKYEIRAGDRSVVLNFANLTRQEE